MMRWGHNSIKRDLKMIWIECARVALKWVDDEMRWDCSNYSVVTKNVLASIPPPSLTIRGGGVGGQSLTGHNHTSSSIFTYCIDAAPLLLERNNKHKTKRKRLIGEWRKQTTTFQRCIIIGRERSLCLSGISGRIREKFAYNYWLVIMKYQKGDWK